MNILADVETQNLTSLHNVIISSFDRKFCLRYAAKNQKDTFIDFILFL